MKCVKTIDDPMNIGTLLDHGWKKPCSEGRFQDAQADPGRFQRRRLLAARRFRLRRRARAARGTQG